MAITLPARQGPRPETGPSVPHLQLSDISPEPIREELRAWARTAFDNVRHGRSLISVPSSEGYFVDPAVYESAVLMPPGGDSEWIHLHADGSVHACLSVADEREVLAKDWGEPHPFRERGVREILVYAPRDDEELKVLKTVFAASYRYATAKA